MAEPTPSHIRLVRAIDKFTDTTGVWIAWLNVPLVLAVAYEVIARYDEGLREWRNHPTRAQMPNGESFSNILKRVLDFKEHLCAQFQGRNVLVSTHDVVVKILVADALGMNMDRINRIWVTNASISVIEYGEDLPYLISLSEACHLGRLETVRERQKAI